jgi:hypothetical protein
MLISQNRDDIQNALCLQRNCELQSVWLLRSDIWREQSDVEFEQPFSLKFSHGSIARIDGKGQLAVEVEFRFDSSDASKASKKTFSLGCTFELCYSLQEGYSPSEKEIAAFKDGNAIFNCWPYAREFAQNIALRMGHAAPPLPLLRVVPQPQSSAGEIGPQAGVKASVRQKVRHKAPA